MDCFVGNEWVKGGREYFRWQGSISEAGRAKVLCNGQSALQSGKESTVILRQPWNNLLERSCYELGKYTKLWKIAEPSTRCRAFNWTNKISNLYKYIWHFGRIHLTIWTTTFCKNAFWPTFKLNSLWSCKTFAWSSTRWHPFNEALSLISRLIGIASLQYHCVPRPWFNLVKS